MHQDVTDLRNFYYRSMLGRAAQLHVRGNLLKLWPEAKGQTVAGYGFAAPLLRPYLPDARRVMALMPAPQGVMPWPAGMPNVSVLCDETTWPVETGHVDKLVVMHGLEVSERPSELLEECLRVLGPGGRAIFVVPNRSGLWARSDRTPFGHGRPYSQTQLETQLRRHGFIPENHVQTLYQPPSSRRFWLKFGLTIEKFGRRFSMVMNGGVLMVEATKRVQMPAGPGVRVHQPRGLKVLEGFGAGKPETARVGSRALGEGAGGR